MNGDPARMTDDEFLAALDLPDDQRRRLDRILSDAARDVRKAEDRAVKDLRTILRLTDWIDRLTPALAAAKSKRTAAARAARAAAADALAVEARRMKRNGTNIADIAKAIHRTPRRVSTLLKRPKPRKS